MNKIVVISFIFVFFIIIIIDTWNNWDLIATGALKIWYWDPDLIKWNDEGFAKATGAIIALVSGALFLMVSIRYKHLRKTRGWTYLSRQIYFSALYSFAARLFEAFFIVSMSGINGLVFSIGKYYIILDAMGAAFFINAVTEVFLIEDSKKNQRYLSIVQYITYLACITGISVLFVRYDTIGVYKLVIVVITFMLLLMIVTILVLVFTKMRNVRSRVQSLDVKKAMQSMEFQLILFAVAIVTLIYLETTEGNTVDYIFRAIRVGLVLLIAFLYIPSFIKPTEKEVMMMKVK
ncbi:MAG: hypothetical protein ACTSYS_17115 [Promethearchaeota archaeon]